MLGDVAVPSDGPVMVPVQTDNLGQHVRIPRVGLRPRRSMAVPVPRRLERVDRIHRVAGRDQRLHPRATIGLRLPPNRGGIGYKESHAREAEEVRR